MTALDSTPSRTHGRLCIVVASVLWSLNGFFVPVLTKDTLLGLNNPAVTAQHIAFYRVLFAGIVLVPGLRRAEITFRLPMLLSAGAFAIMNLVFVFAMTEGVIASAMFLQYTAPVWLYLVCVYGLGEPADRRGLVSVMIALVGIFAIVAGGWHDNGLRVMALGLASGITYAGVLLGIRLLRSESSRWITVVNLMTAAAFSLPLLFFVPNPSWAQLATLVVFGGLQLGLPYLLMARGLRSVDAREAGTLTLIEPILSPIWAFLVADQRPQTTTWIGGAFILAALLYRYAPLKKPKRE